MLDCHFRRLRRQPQQLKLPVRLEVPAPPTVHFQRQVRHRVCKRLPDEARDVRRVVEGRVEHDQLFGAVLESLEANDGQGVAWHRHIS